ncbi:MAG: hypothetical protein ABL927_04835 [Bdellovibrionales bacterium]
MSANDKSGKNPDTKDEPKIISEIHVNWLASVDPREEFLDDYHHCPLCGNELIYTHNTQFIHNFVTEEAQCPSCNVKVKNNQHSLQ